MKRIILTISLIILITNINAQDYSNKFDVKFGTGLGFMGSGDKMALCFENELTYKINSYFSTSALVGIGRNLADHKYSHNDYLLGSLNLFVSPFRNNRRNNFKIGAGYTLINETASYYPLADNPDTLKEVTIPIIII